MNQERFQVPKGDVRISLFKDALARGYRQQLILLHQRNSWEDHCYHCLKTQPWDPFEDCPKRVRTPVTRMQLLTEDK